MKQINVDVSQKSNNSKVPKNLDTISQIIGEIDENALYFVDVNSKSFTVAHKQLVSQILESVLKNIPQVEGVGISKIEKTSTEGLVDTYAVILTDGSTYYFTITNGKDGISATHSWNGTTLTITSASGTSSADLKGADGKDGKDGVNGKDGTNGKDGVNGKDGLDGTDGYTPKKGTDYFTEEDKAEIAEQTKKLIDLSSYQPKTDETLKTDSREVVGAINELNNMLISPANSVITNLKGTTWLMKEPSEFETPMALGNSTIGGEPYSVNFISNDTEYKSLTINRTYNGSIWWYTLGYDKTYVNNNTIFFNQAHKFVTFTGGADTTNPRLISWVCTNCMLLKADIWNVINELNTSIVGCAWVLNDVIDTSQGDFEYVFDFVSNGQKFTSMQLQYNPIDIGTNYWGYYLYYWNDIAGEYAMPYTTEDSKGWIDEAYRTIITDNLDISLDNIGIKSTTVIANGLATNSKTLVGAVNELKTDIKNVKMYAENVKHEVVLQAYYNEEDKKWYEDIDFTVVIPNISLFNITLDFNKKDVYFALGKVNLSDWFATEEKHTALANGVNAFQKAYDNTIEKIFGTKNEELETESKIIVGAVNELNKKIGSAGEKVTDLTGKTYYIPSGWEVTKGYGKFDVISFIDGETTKTFEALNLGYGSRYNPELQGNALVEGANSLVFGKPSTEGILVGDYLFKYSSSSGFTVTFTGGTDVTNTNLIDWLDTWGELQVPEYQTKTDENLETESKEIVGAINELNDKINATGGGSTEEMPQIRFVGMPCRGYLGWVDWSQIDGDQTDSYENLKFTIEIVSGTLQVGDAIQLCRMSKYSGSKSYAHDGTKKYHPPKRKLRRLFEYTITEEDLEKRFITFEVPWNDKKAIKLFTKWATSGVNDKTIYFRIRRPKGEINSGSNGGGMTVDAEFSNVVSIRCLSYDFEWYPNDETAYFCQIRIT